MSAVRRRWTPLAGVLLAAVALAPAVHAGGGPETVLVVVNAESPVSWQVANHYVRLRGIPATHVCPVSGVPGTGTITVGEFRDVLWAQIKTFLVTHGLFEHVDIIAYSADFPFAVDYDPDFKDQELPQGTNKFRVASLTGLTYMIRHVEEKSRSYLNLIGNRYCRWDKDVVELRPARGFQSDVAWGADAQPQTPQVGAESMDRYFLSTMLGFTGVQGNTVPEILAYLRTGADSDGTQPKGTVYLMEHGDVRARTRMPYFAGTQRALEARQRGVAVLKPGAEKQDGVLPITKLDVMGAVVGIAGFDWNAAGSRFLPGAIAEHLTSFGAKFDGSGQTKCSEFLRAGAVGTSGAVAEPFALWMKFPLPYLHVDYADGCCLAEAFYQNVAGPYQLLVLGDPLARPFAQFAKVALAAPDVKAAWSGTVELDCRVTPAKERAIAHVELWVDGVPAGRGTPGQPLALDTTGLADGGHELRLVAVEDGAIETRSSSTTWFEVDNAGRSVSIKGPRKAVGIDDEVALSGKAIQAKAVRVCVGHRVLAEARLAGGSWKVGVPAGVLGVGTVAVQARASYEDGAEVASLPAEVTVETPFGAKRKPAPRKKPAPAKGKAGLEARVTDERGKEHAFAATTLAGSGGSTFLKELKGLVKAKAKRILLGGEFEAPVDGLYQLAVRAAGALRVEVAGRTVVDAPALPGVSPSYVAVALEAGWHALEIEYEPSGEGALEVLLSGAQVAAALEGKALRH